MLFRSYPWDGLVKLTLNLSQPAAVTFRLRVPDWCRSHRLSVNGKAIEARVERGYAVVERTWHRGDVITLELAMAVERVEAHPLVDADMGRVALQRGPMIYCIEQADHATPVSQISLPADAELSTTHHAELLDGVTVIRGLAEKFDVTPWQGKLYQFVNAPGTMTANRSEDDRRIELRAIPYFAWDNRQPGPMTVWLAASKASR